MSDDGARARAKAMLFSDGYAVCPTCGIDRPEDRELPEGLGLTARVGRASADSEFVPITVSLHQPDCSAMKA